MSTLNDDYDALAAFMEWVDPGGYAVAMQLNDTDEGDDDADI